MIMRASQRSGRNHHVTNTNAPVPGILMLDLEGPELTEDEQALLLEPAVGGVILFSRNVRDREQVRQLTGQIRQCSPELLVAVDQEGGRVQRLRDGFTRLPPMARFGELYTQDSARALSLSRDCGWLMATEVLSAGIDFSFAPVLDLGRAVSRVIGDRAFSASAAVTAALATAFLQGMQEAGMATTGKHFPGHGGVAADSHSEIPVDTRSLTQLENEDLIPFVRCLPLLDAIMPAHIIYSSVDAGCAGFSSYWLQTVLRGRMGFEGVIFSDDLVMAGAAAAGGMPERVNAALEAGCDMLLICNNRSLALEALEHVCEHHADALTNTRLLAMRHRGGDCADNMESERRQQVISELKSLIRE